MKKYFLPTLAGAVVGLGVALQVSAPVSAQSNSDLQTIYEQLDLFGDIFERIRAEYVEEVDDVALIEAAINGMLTSLDPHSSYLPPTDYDEMQVETRGEFGGLGIEVTMEDGFVKVISPIDDTPAARAGIQPGDYITEINGKPIIGQTLNDAVKEMRGEKGTEIEITILREGVDPFQVNLVRDVVQQKSVTWKEEANNIAYIRVSTFNERTGALLEEAVEGINRDIGPKPAGIVLDLRNNGGGLLDEAVKVSDFFLSGGEVVSTQGRRPIDVERRNATKAEVFKGVPLVVLINGGSASASEIVAGALQDRGRALVVGTTSFGKGSVQSVIPLGAERGAIRLTTARYYTPSGRSIQALGIEPDIMVTPVRLTEEELAKIQRFSEADLPHALANESGIERAKLRMPDEQPPVGYEGEDFQLERAIQLLGEGRASASRLAMQAGKAG